MSYLLLPDGAKVQNVLSRDWSRPALTIAMLRESDDGWELVGTDNYRLAVVPLELVEDNNPAPVAGRISRDALTAICRSGAFSANGETIRPLERTGEKTGVQYDRPSQDGSFPDDAKLWPDDSKKPKVVFALNAKLLHGLADAWGAEGVELEVFDPMGPIRVRPQGGRAGRGIMIPIRIV